MRTVGEFRNADIVRHHLNLTARVTSPVTGYDVNIESLGLEARLQVAAMSPLNKLSWLHVGAIGCHCRISSEVHWQDAWICHKNRD